MAQAQGEVKIWPANYVINVKVFPVALQQQSRVAELQPQQQLRHAFEGVRVGRKKSIEKENCIFAAAFKTKISERKVKYIYKYSIYM